MDFKKTDATRYLCAAAYLDSTFRDYVIRELIEERHKAVGPSHGVDAVAVAKHCLAVRRRKRMRDLWLAVLFLPVLFSALFGGLEQLSFLPILILLLPVAFSLVFWEKWATYSTVLHHLLKGNFNPDAVQQPSNPRLQRILDELGQRQNGNVTVHSGFFPFVGSGNDIGGWSFALDARKGKEGLEGILDPIPFSVGELYASLGADIEKLNLDRVTIEDKVYVHGQDIRDDRRFLADVGTRPYSSVGPEVLEAAVGHPSQTVRHYRCIRVTDWSGELVLSIFLRFSKLSHNLFVEANYFLLTPLADKYRAVDTWSPRPRFWDVLTLFVQAAFITPFAFVASPLVQLLNVFAYVERCSQQKEIQKQAGDNPLFDYGANGSVRQVASAWAYRRYFQKLDKEMYVKILERQILDSILTFLESRNIDTSDLKERQTTILNSGVIVSGGSITAESLAVGRGAHGVVTRVTRFGQRTAEKAGVAVGGRGGE